MQEEFKDVGLMTGLLSTKYHFTSFESSVFPCHSIEAPDHSLKLKVLCTALHMSEVDQMRYTVLCFAVV